MKPDERITYIGRVDHRNVGTVFGIRQRDRRSHLYVIGKTGTGKSHLLRVMFEQDLAAGQGCALFDPHGELAHALRPLAESRTDTIWFDATNPATEWRFNPFADVPANKHPLAAAGLVEAFKKIWPEDWGPRLEHLLRNVVFTLLETPGSSLASIPALLTDREYRSGVVSGLQNPVVKEFWTGEFDRYSPAFRAVVTAPLQNKVGALLTDPLLRRILTEEGRVLDLDETIAASKVLLVNLDKGQIGEGPAALLGSLLVSHIALIGLTRGVLSQELRKDFFVYLDEFQTFTTEFLATMLSELRKYQVGLVLAHQYLDQLTTPIRDAVFGNAGSIISFRVGAADAGFLAREFAPRFGPVDLTSLPRFSVYVRLMIDGATSQPFSATTLDRAPAAPGPS